LTEEVWLEKHRLITDLTGFGPIVGKRVPLREKKGSGASIRVTVVKRVHPGATSMKVLF